MKPNYSYHTTTVHNYLNGLTDPQIIGLLNYLAFCCGWDEVPRDEAINETTKWEYIGSVKYCLEELNFPQIIIPLSGGTCLLALSGTIKEISK